MALCVTECAPDLPVSYTGGCGVTLRNGGISKLAFIKCDYEFTDIASRTEWEAAIASKNVVLTGLLVGQKPKGSFTKKRITSCGPEAIVGGEKTITFQDFNSDAADCADVDFWNAIQLNATNYRFGYYTCDGYFYGPIDNFQVEVDQVIEDNNTGSIFWDGTITWNATQVECGVAVNLDGI
jgi:hypothetical protein